MINFKLILFSIFSWFLFIILISGCTGLKSVGVGQHLYTKSTMEFDSVKTIPNPREIKEELDELITLKPNINFLWMRPFLSFHNMIPEPKKKKGFKYWLKYKLGEPPALFESINLKDLNAAVENRMQNRGYFHAKSKFIVSAKKKTAKVKYIISPDVPYTIKSVRYPEGKAGISAEISRLQPESIIKPGVIYNLSDFENERRRIDAILKEKGYFYFNPDFLLFTADTSSGDKTVNVWLNFKPEMPANAGSSYSFENIYVFDDYSLRDFHPDTTKIGNYYYASEKHQFNPGTILNAVFLEKDSLYSRKDHYNTLKQLMGIGIYKFANTKFELNDLFPGKLDVNVLLTPVRKISLSSEFGATFKTTNFAGPGLNLNYKNHNIFGAAELFVLTLGGSFETQISGASKGQTSFQVTLNGALTIPKMVLFGFKEKVSKTFVSKTIFNAGVGIFSRVNLYDLRSFNISMGYSIKPNERTVHQFSPLDISYSNLVNSTAEFEDYLNENPNVRKSFEEQFIIGNSYNFIYTKPSATMKHLFYLNETVDMAGNLASLATIKQNTDANPEGQRELLGIAFSQFIRIRNEIRYFYSIDKKNQLAFRFIAGAGVPYGNSTTIPYIKQYFVGGTNSIRAFIARSIGPGTYHPPDSIANIYVDQAGDIKLESTFEYRFDIYKIFKGALFVDAGNIWLVNDDPQRSGGKFNSNTFISQLAMGSGIGFRFDFSFVILRLDVAFPLRIPYLPEDERWVVDRIAFGKHSWRHDNIVWNIAIGYPF